MTRETPHTTAAQPVYDVASSRFASLIRTDTLDGARVAMLGLPDDLGVRMNGGRGGAWEGPAAFRQALARYGAAAPALATVGTWPAVADAGDVEAAGDDLEETHRRVRAASRSIAERGIIPIGIGGGHDLTLPLVLGVADALGRALDGVYFDAHLDVRDETGSGMPFRRLLEAGAARSLSVHGLDAIATDRTHLDWYRAHGGRVAWDDAEAESAGSWPDGDCFVSFDLDVLDQAHAPGVSATNPAGWSPRRACDWCHNAGRHAGVRCFDIMELNPHHDRGGMTARLAARLFLEFLAGLADRHGSDA
ncbi:MAG: arginase family protein [Planctomycetota bacterium]